MDQKSQAMDGIGARVGTYPRPTNRFVMGRFQWTTPQMIGGLNSQPMSYTGCVRKGLKKVFHFSDSINGFDWLPPRTFGGPRTTGKALVLPHPHSCTWPWIGTFRFLLFSPNL